MKELIQIILFCISYVIILHVAVQITEWLGKKIDNPVLWFLMVLFNALMSGALLALFLLTILGIPISVLWSH